MRGRFNFLTLIGIAVLITGVVLLATAIPQAMDFDNFGIPVGMILGPFLIVIGFAITISSTMASVIDRGAKHIKDSGISSSTKSLFGALREAISPQNRVCKYCGSENKPKATKCSSCGANLTEDDKQ